MPKESVRDAVTVGKLAMVGWTPGGQDHDGGVQVAVIDSNVKLVPQVEFDEHGIPHEPGSTEPVDGLSVDLDRAGINRLIRVLRRARDHAYGADA